MRKIVFSLIMCLLLIGTIYAIFKGIEPIKVQGFKGINEKDGEIEQSIMDLSNEISVKYVSADTTLKRAANTLHETKTEYENQAILSQTNNSGYASGKEAYDIDYLWTKLGNYAKEENVVIKIDVIASDISTNLYDLNFTVLGDYSNITNFIYDIENDSKLGFKIDAFKMTAASNSEKTNITLSASFECKQIFITVGEIEQSSGKTRVTDGNITVEPITDGVPVKGNEKTTGNASTNTTSKSATNTTTNTTANTATNNTVSSTTSSATTNTQNNMSANTADATKTNPSSTESAEIEDLNSKYNL